MKQVLRVFVILLFVFSASNTRQCGDRTTVAVDDGSVTIRNIGVKMCQLKCIEHGTCLNLEYDIETLTCRLSRDESKKTEKKAGYRNLSKNNSNVSTSHCASKTCAVGLRCLSTRSGHVVCVEDGKQKYPERSLTPNTDNQEASEAISLLNACRKGDLMQVRRIMECRVSDVNSRDKAHGTTPRMLAASKGHRIIYDFLIRQQANASLTDYYGNNILHWACTGGHVDMVEHVLTQYSMYINSRTKSGTTPLMKAVCHGHIDVYDYLLGRGANVSLVDDGGNTILHLACLRRQLKMVNYILSQDVVNVNYRNKLERTPLMITAFSGNMKMFELLANKGGSGSLKDIFGSNILHLASSTGHLKIVKHILSQKMTDINAKDNKGYTAALSAKSAGHHRVSNFLVSKGCLMQ